MAQNLSQGIVDKTTLAISAIVKCNFFTVLNQTLMSSAKGSLELGSMLDKSSIASHAQYNLFSPCGNAEIAIQNGRPQPAGGLVELVCKHQHVEQRFENGRINLAQILTKVFNINRDALVNTLETIVTTNLQVAHSVIVDTLHVLRVHALAQTATKHCRQFFRQPFERRVNKARRNGPQEESKRSAKDFDKVFVDHGLGIVSNELGNFERKPRAHHEKAREHHHVEKLGAIHARHNDADNVA